MINYIAAQGEDVQALHNKYSGRIFILGNGPSLRNLTERNVKDLAGGEDTWACNNWRLWDRHWNPHFYTVSYQVFNGWVDTYSGPPTHSLLKQFLHYIVDPKDLIPVPGWVHVQVDNINRSPALSAPLTTLQHGGSTPHINAQLAAWMGYTEIYMLGCEQTDGYVYDPNAFRNANKSRGFYVRQKQQLFEDLAGDLYKYGVSLKDCTPGGALNEVLEYVPLEEVLGHNSGT